MVGDWHGTLYQVASVTSTANVVIVACGPAGRHTTYPKSGHRHTKDPSSGPSTWYERQVLSEVTLAQPLQVLAFSGAKPPAWAKPYATRPSHDTFTFQARGDGQVRLALVAVREADDAVSSNAACRHVGNELRAGRNGKPTGRSAKRCVRPQLTARAALSITGPAPNCREERPATWQEQRRD